MPNKEISILANVLLPVCTMLATVGLFFLFMPEGPLRLFYTNFVLTLWLETVFFGYLAALRKDTEAFSVPLLAFLGVGAVYYIAVAGVWMLAYSLLLTGILSYKVYMAAHIIVCLAWLGTCILMAQQDNAYHERTAELQQMQKETEDFGQRANLLLSRYQTVLIEKGCPASDGGSSMEVLRNKMRGLPPQTARSAQAYARLTEAIRQLDELITSLEEAEEPEKIRQTDEQIKRYARKTADELDLLKRQMRK